MWLGKKGRPVKVVEREKHKTRALRAGTIECQLEIEFSSKAVESALTLYRIHDTRVEL
jgi:hypothetical protein